MKFQKVKTICIVGGGSSGWMTAAYALNNLPWANIILVESPNIPTVGVGEATLLNFDTFLQNDCGIPEVLWKESCGATVKAGILFAGWADDNKDIWHPFFFTGSNITHANGTMEYYSRATLANQAGLDFDDWLEYSTTWYDLSAKRMMIPDLRRHRVGWHVDAIRLANFLSSFLREKYPTKLTHVLGDVSDVEVTDGNITSILVNGEHVQADVFIDCTGFKRLLSSKLEGSEFVVADKMLFANAAVAGPVRYETEDDVIPPYTICQAVEHGWIWKTSIEGRIGSGLVYNDTLLTKEEAEEFFVNHWGKERMLTEKFNHIKFKPEYNANNWRGNCFSVGLASGFIEPLESTGLHLIIKGAMIGLDCLRKRYFTNYDRQYYNSELSTLYSSSIDYVALHYYQNTHQGPFWDKMRAEFEISPTLDWQIKMFNEDYINEESNQFNHIFSKESWRIWLMGMGHKIKSPEYADAKLALLDLVSYDKRTIGMTNREQIAFRKEAFKQYTDNFRYNKNLAPGPGPGGVLDRMQS